MSQFRRAVGPLVAFTVAGLLVGCSNEPSPAPPASSPSAVPAEPVATPTETSAEQGLLPQSTPTTTRALPAPQLSELGTTFTQDGASAFAGYYVQVLNYARNSGDVELLHSISDPGCSGCSYDVDEIQKMLERGYSHVDLATQFRGTWYRSWDPEIGEIQMDVTVDRPAHTIIDRDGHQIADVPALDEATFFLWLKWVDDRWIVWESK